MDDFLKTLHHSLIVSCQARENEPLRFPQMMAAMAAAAVQGGAKAIRANGADDIRAIRDVVDVPIFGINKQQYPDSDVYITPTIEAARAIVEAGCHVLTVEATNRSRPKGETLEAFFQALKREFQLPIMADVSTVEEGITAAGLGADIVATTMSGYTPYSRQMAGPDLQLIQELAAAVDVPVIAEGRIATPDDVRAAIDHGAYAVVVGSMITRPGHITTYFMRGLPGNA